ncbi:MULTISPECIES: hypothetical protein [Campylobacter]|uniref:Uncharacterized protein n=2 Tax=Campylobacter porcelli TaxID=1660073 RepID=A0ABU7M3K8_9BACT|nr:MULTISPECIES: hypothetical protein [unclassified Campylobacter]MCR8678823.1 hypothetical protein [Campylobacter sp. RM19072]MCR8695980.1 hypothetical protein [Campylobacter sp. RM19073]MEE3704876.1 hypothetical protein [Campylobacter sp. CX2-8023-23]MEE3744154.1 hypothetical protein [Campylobacter sp. CX2-4855-23]MEE3776899.1 hypothetical protein [Campylobacter sp. CX2-4080-23]
MMDKICNILDDKFPQNGVFSSEFEWLYFYKINKKANLATHFMSHHFA